MPCVPQRCSTSLACLDIDLADVEANTHPVGLEPIPYVTHLVAPYPSEIHAFLGLLHQTDFVVVTDAGVWTLDGGRIVYTSPLPEGVFDDVLYPQP